LERSKPCTASPRQGSLTPIEHGDALGRLSGIGAEYAVAPPFTVKVEYLYDFINARPVVFNPVAGSWIPFGTRTA
jgi:hypothetical protein